MSEEIKPFEQSIVDKNSVLENLNYTSQDFYSLKSRLVSLIQERFGTNGTELPGTFNDFVEGSVYIMLLETIAFTADTLSFKIDQIANEVFIDTVRERENAFRQAKLIGFQPQPPIAARSMWSASLVAPLSNDVTIATPFVVSVPGQAGVNIELFPANSKNEPIFNESILIPAGSITNFSIIGLEGTSVLEETIGTGLPSQTIQLGRSPVIYDSIRLEVNGTLWSQVDYFTDSQPRNEFRVEYDSNYVAYIIFGNNSAGKIPPINSIIRTSYRVGGGQGGNIVTGSIETQTLAVYNGQTFPVTLRNYTKGEFGYNGDTIEEIRRKLPLYAKTQNRAVSGEDYKNLTDQFSTPYHGQIGKSTAVLRNQGCAGNIVDLYILQKQDQNDLTEAGNELKVDLYEYLSDKKMITHYLCIKDGVVVRTDVAIEILLDRFYRKNENEYRTRITQVVNDFFALPKWEYGQTLRESDLIKEFSYFTEAKTIDINFTTEDEDNSGSIVTTRFFEIIRPDVITINFSYE